MLLHLTMKLTAQPLTTLAGGKHFIVEGVTDDVISLAANILAAVKDTWHGAVGNPTELKDRVQKKGRHPDADSYGAPGATYQSSRTVHANNSDNSHRLDGP